MKYSDPLNDISTDSKDTLSQMSHGDASCDHNDRARLFSPPNERYPSYMANYKTEMCKNFESGRHCKWGVNCCFAHGKKELRSRQPRDEFKMKLCKGFNESGICSYGMRCQFLHFKPFSMYQESFDAFKLSLSHRISTHPSEPLAMQLAGLQVKNKRLSLFKSIEARREKERNLVFSR